MNVRVDIYVNKKKLNVGIATVGTTSGKIHYGLNIASTGAPHYVDIVGLLELGIKEKELENIALNIAEKYVSELKQIKEDCAKTRSL